MKKHTFWLGPFLIIVVLCSVISIVVFSNNYKVSMNAKATATMEAILTETHYTEVAQVIENYHLRALSLEVYKEPELRREFTTAPHLNDSYLEWWLDFKGRDQAKDNIITNVTAVTVTHLRILEYTPQRFKAVATVEETIERIDMPEEIVVESNIQGSYPNCGIYVFVRESTDVWKLSSYLFLEDAPAYILREEYEQMTGELKQVIGEFPTGELCNRQEFRDWLVDRQGGGDD